jgi:hypothetical protein
MQTSRKSHLNRMKRVSSPFSKHSQGNKPKEGCPLIGHGPLLLKSTGTSDAFAMIDSHEISRLLQFCMILLAFDVTHAPSRAAVLDQRSSTSLYMARLHAIWASLLIYLYKIGGSCDRSSSYARTTTSLAYANVDAQSRTDHCNRYPKSRG